MKYKIGDIVKIINPLGINDDNKKKIRNAYVKIVSIDYNIERTFPYEVKYLDRDIGKRFYLRIIKDEEIRHIRKDEADDVMVMLL